MFGRTNARVRVLLLLLRMDSSVYVNTLLLCSDHATRNYQNDLVSMYHHSAVARRPSSKEEARAQRHDTLARPIVFTWKKACVICELY